MRYCWLYRPVPDFVPLGKVRRFDPLSRNPSLGFGFCFEPMKACHAALIEHMHRHAAPIVGTDSVSRHARNMAEVSGRSRQHRPPSLGNRAAHPADLAMSISVLGKSPLAFFQDLRIERAVHLLEISHSSVDQIAAQVGYADGVTLRVLLRRQLGRGVREIRRSL